MDNLAIIVLAAGKGTRMRSGMVKVLHSVLGRPLLSYPVSAVRKAFGSAIMVIVIGHQGEAVRNSFADSSLAFVEQTEQHGTGHAVMMTEPMLKDFKGTLLILCGDIPLITSQTLLSLVDVHRKQQAVVTVLSTSLQDPSGYGRIVRTSNGTVKKIVEEKDATGKLRKIKEINSGIYCVEASFLYQAISRLRSDNAQKEYYLPDIIEIASKDNKIVGSFVSDDPLEILGVNTRADLAKVDEILSERVKLYWMSEGVTIYDPSSVRIEADVFIGRDTIIYPNCSLRGNTIVGEWCSIGPHVEIIDSVLKDNVTIRFCSMITESSLENGVVVGPFSHLRPQTYLGEGVKVGNFVEVKKSRIQKGSKANHLSYIGDADVGQKVNIGAGTITCNYDGEHKHKTIIEDGAFIGSNTALVAPIRIGKEASLAAGSALSKDVPPFALAVARPKQRHIRNWATRKRKRRERRVAGNPLEKLLDF